MKGLIWDDEPSASNKLDKKYIIKININEAITVLVNLLFCFKSATNEDAKIVRIDKKKGKIIKL